MFNILSIIFKYIFIVIIYLFIFSIIRLIYMDIKSTSIVDISDGAYIKLLNRKESIPYLIKEYYPIKHRLNIGRDKSNNVVLKDPYVSSRHCSIILEDGIYFIEDMDSSNGTYLNDEKLLDVAVLGNKDRIKIGDIEFIFMNRG